MESIDTHAEWFKARRTTTEFIRFMERPVAYFCAEYALAQNIPTYSGGLGILSGDHLRGASDLGLKMVGVGLFYLHGYYEQEVTSNGTMKVIYDSVVPPKTGASCDGEPRERGGTPAVA